MIYLREYRNHRSVGQSGGGPELVGRLGVAIGLDSQFAHPHALRHTFATRYLADRKADVAQLQRVLGHADIKTTSIYLTVCAHQVDDVVERWPSLTRPSTPTTPPASDSQPAN